MRFASVALLAMCLLLSARPASAQTDGRAEARAAFEQGVTALDEGRFAEAVELLGRSLELREAASALYNHALALRGAGRYREAVAQLERYLEVASGRRYRRSRALAVELLEELRAAIGHLHLEVVGQPDVVEVAGHELEGVGPHELEVDPGSVRVVVRRHGYAPVEREVEVATGATLELRIDASETPLPARLRIEVEPATASIRLDGRLLGTGEADVETDAGEHNVAFEADGHLPELRDVDLAPGDETQLAVVMTLAPVDVVTEWWLWTSVGVGVALVAGIVLAVVLANDVPPIQQGSLGFSQEVLLEF